MQPHDPQAMAMQQHGGRTKVTPPEPSPPPVPALRRETSPAECAPRPERLAESG